MRQEANIMAKFVGVDVFACMRNYSDGWLDGGAAERPAGRPAEGSVLKSAANKALPDRTVACEVSWISALCAAKQAVQDSPNAHSIRQAEGAKPTRTVTSQRND